MAGGAVVVVVEEAAACSCESAPRKAAMVAPLKLWSGRRESNPRSQLGKLMFCR